MSAATQNSGNKLLTALKDTLKHIATIRPGSLPEVEILNISIDKAMEAYERKISELTDEITSLQNSADFSGISIG